MPIGVLVRMTAKKNRLLLSTLVGLFLSETIECSQLIWQRGTFDVNDLLNNTLGAFFGGLIVVLGTFFMRKREECVTSMCRITIRIRLTEKN